MTTGTISETADVFQILDPEGNLDDNRLEIELSRSLLTSLYRDMMLSRRFDQRCINLQRQGKLGTYASVRGQEAAQVGVVRALEGEGILFPSYRETAAVLARGIEPSELFLYWAGDERGHRSGRSRGVFPFCVDVGSHPIHAVGAARARQIQGNPTLAVPFFGDGATSEADFLAALNFAGVWETPVLFFCQNNQWAISVPREQQTASETLAQKSEAFGFPGERVDGNDPLAVYQLTRRLHRRCLEEPTPYFVEAITYRLGDHTTADDARRYRTEEEVEAWKKRDPLKRLRLFLERQYDWTRQDQSDLESEVDQVIDNAWEEYCQIPDPDPDSILESTYETLPDELRQQRDELRAERSDV